MTTSKLNTNPTILSKLETTPNLNSYNCDVGQQRISPSKRTAMINNLDPLIDNNNTTVLHQSKTCHSSRSTKQKEKCENANISLSKPESVSEEMYTTPLNNDDTRISSSIKQKQQARQEMGDYIRRDPNEDADEESMTTYAIMRKNKTPNEHIHSSLISSNNSAMHVQQQQQQGMGDHYHTSTRQHRTRSKTTGLLNRKYQRLMIEQQDLDTSLDEKNTYRWRIFIYIILLVVLAFIVYRFCLAVWPKRKKTLMEQFIDDIYNFFTP
ncbi:unnamed protein product [Rotaria socialis]|uniref:Uncharacterized protein n=2 Tax=Rotaria socialis TaxID=392032 RepID=A0A817QX53_9BILA|nr:unnamed protein product [Rotaria socialis]